MSTDTAGLTPQELIEIKKQKRRLCNARAASRARLKKKTESITIQETIVKLTETALAMSQEASELIQENSRLRMQLAELSGQAALAAVPPTTICNDTFPTDFFAEEVLFD
eukprot:gnl/Spiro4/21429_TR10485_c0_g1_i1.p1 gnl/Spiro4/21429_TR10485_c0_g1~~gnl/Spiro4/21429_TR10485_c0_g1_i1.p1  ORF type:complete len:110 (+),score=31.99 gnl/Spiro4/21429_TR10485_c0_g1_i1:105-434(+)